MKKVSLFVLSGLLFQINDAIAMPINSNNSHLFANNISVNNISAIQHSIMLQAMQTFQTKNALNSNISHNSPNLYGKMPVYGTESLYGEYNVTDAAPNSIKGRNGGDDLYSDIVGNLWLNWNHFDEDVNINGYGRLDSDYDLLMLDLSGDEKLWGNPAKIGFFGGYVGGDQSNNYLHISENGGFIGFYAGYNINNLNFAVAFDTGTLYNEVTALYADKDFSNTWLGASFNMTYDIPLDSTFMLQPGLYSGYTWIKSADYTYSTSEIVQNDNLSTFEFTPFIRAIKNIYNGWFGYIGVKYAFVSNYGGDININSTTTNFLDTDNYSEYGIGIEKSIDSFYISLHLNRHDGGRSGWNGGFSMKYIF